MNANISMNGTFSTGNAWQIKKSAERGPCGADGCKGIHGEYVIQSEGQTVPLSQLGNVKAIRAKLKQFGVDGEGYAEEINDVVQAALTVVGKTAKKAEPKAAKKKARRRR